MVKAKKDKKGKSKKERSTSELLEGLSKLLKEKGENEGNLHLFETTIKRSVKKSDSK